MHLVRVRLHCLYYVACVYTCIRSRYHKSVVNNVCESTVCVLVGLFLPDEKCS